MEWSEFLGGRYKITRVKEKYLVGVRQGVYTELHGERGDENPLLFSQGPKSALDGVTGTNELNGIRVMHCICTIICMMNTIDDERDC